MITIPFIVRWLFLFGLMYFVYQQSGWAVVVSFGLISVTLETMFWMIVSLIKAQNERDSN